MSLAIWLLGGAGCQGAGGALGGRAAPDPLTAVEAYLQIYQPGPLPRIFQSTFIYDRNNQLLAELFSEGRRQWIGVDQMSPHLINATIATEDISFYTNPGVDPMRIAGAALQNTQEGEIVSGASTITMQLARNLFLGPQERYNQSLDRKLQEVGLAQELTALYTKDELLEMYLNLLNYGHHTYGPEAAAQAYFAKPAQALSLAEASLLAGIPQQPARLDPLQNLVGARLRQRTVLDLMVRHGLVTAEEADAAFAEPLTFNPEPDAAAILAPHFVTFVVEQLDSRLGAGYTDRAGLRIFSTLDLPMQNLAQEVVQAKVAELQPLYDLSNAALVAMTPANGQILAMVGSADFTDPAIDGQVNVAVSLRQPGSAIKPLLYATAMEDNLISPASVVWDVPVTYTVGAGQPVYTPHNYDNRFHGPVTVRTALANSYNIPAIKVLAGVTVPRMLESVRRMGLTSLFRDPEWYGLSLTLGGGEVTLLDLTTGFQTLANQGRFTAYQSVLAVTDSQGQPVANLFSTQSEQVVSPAAAFLVSDILSDNQARTPAFGAQNLLTLSQPAAAKTGTTTDWRDNWTVGYTRYLVAGVWAGNTDGRPMRNVSGVTGAAPIWHDFMQAVLENPDLLATLDAPADEAAWTFLPPDGVERRGDCPPGVTCRTGGEYFSQGWLDAAGQQGPLADSVVETPVAAVFVEKDGVRLRRAYCSLAEGSSRLLLQQPHGLGLFANPDLTSDSAQTLEAGTIEEQFGLEQLHVIGWALMTGEIPVNLGPCAELPQRALAARRMAPYNGTPTYTLFLAGVDDSEGQQVVVLDGTDSLAGDAGTFNFAAGSGTYGLAQPVAHNEDCPGNYIMGKVMDSNGNPQAGVRIHWVDQWGNQAVVASKSGGGDFGMFDFQIHHRPIYYTVMVVDGSNNPLSAPVQVNHLQGDGGQASCHWIFFRAG